MRAVALVAALVAALLAVGACSSGSSSSPPLPSAKDVAGYTATVCGAVRALGGIAPTLPAAVAGLREDSQSRLALRSAFVARLTTAIGAAAAGARYLRSATVPTSLSGHRSRLVAALERATTTYGRWEQFMSALPTYDRDIWEDDLLSYERSDMTQSGAGPWRAVRAAAVGGRDGRAIARAIPHTPACSRLGFLTNP